MKLKNHILVAALLSLGFKGVGGVSIHRPTPMLLPIRTATPTPKVAGAQPFTVGQKTPELPRTVGSFVVRVTSNPSRPGKRRAHAALDDSAAFQAALDSIPATGGTVLLPETLTETRKVVVTHNLTTIKCAVPGCVVNHADHFENENSTVEGLIQTPLDSSGNSVTISDLTIDGVTFDGQFYRPPGEPGGGLGAIGLFSVRRVLIQHSTIRQFFFDSISILAGRPIASDITIRQNNIYAIRRNGLSVGSAQNFLIDSNWIHDAPSQHYAPAAGNGIDNEVEGYFELTFGRESNNIIERTGTRTAGSGIALQAAYHPLSDLVLSTNVIINHQVGILIDGGSQQDQPDKPNIARVWIDRNWIRSDAGNQTSGGPLYVYGEKPAGGRAIRDIMVTGNIYNGRNGPGPGQYRFYDALNIIATGNTLLVDPTFDCAFYVQTGGGVTISGTRYSSPCFLTQKESPNVLQLDNQSAALPVSVPSVAFTTLHDGSTLTPSADVSVSANGVARVYFFVDDVPFGFSDSAPFQFALPSETSMGNHRLGLRAVGPYADVTEMIGISVQVLTPAKPLPRNSSKPRYSHNHHDPKGSGHHLGGV
jgi:Right handed beta helix region